MRSKSYDDGCATAHAMDLVGDRWALLIVRELMFGPKRFTDLRAELRTISPNVLTQRLDELEAATIVQRRQLPPPAASWIYELTDWGRELEAPILVLGRWAARSPFLQQGLPISRAALLLALRAMYQPEKGGDFCIRLDFPEGPAIVQGTEAGLKIDLNPATEPAVDAVLAGTPMAIDRVVFGELDIRKAVSDGQLTVSGDRQAIERFVQAFRLPRPLVAT